MKPMLPAHLAGRKSHQQACTYVAQSSSNHLDAETPAERQAGSRQLTCDEDASGDKGGSEIAMVCAAASLCCFARAGEGAGRAKTGSLGLCIASSTLPDVARDRPSTAASAYNTTLINQTVMRSCLHWPCKTYGVKWPLSVVPC